MMSAGASATVAITRGSASTVTARARASGWPRPTMVRPGGKTAGIGVVPFFRILVPAIGTGSSRARPQPAAWGKLKGF
jgi:hypothetical protein